MKKILPIIIVLFIVAIGAYSYLTGGKISFGPGGVNTSKTITSTSETFSGSIKAAIEKGIPLKCTNDLGVTGYIKGKKYYGEVNQQGKQGYVIMVDNCMWTWDKGGTQGAKMCFQSDVWEQQGTPQGNVKCESYGCARLNIYSTCQYNLYRC